MHVKITVRDGVDPSKLILPGKPVIDGRTITYDRFGSVSYADGWYCVDDERVAPGALIESFDGTLS